MCRLSIFIFTALLLDLFILYREVICICFMLCFNSFHRISLLWEIYRSFLPFLRAWPMQFIKAWTVCFLILNIDSVFSIIFCSNISKYRYLNFYVFSNFLLIVIYIIERFDNPNLNQNIFILFYQIFGRGSGMASAWLVQTRAGDVIPLHTSTPIYW
jgi:hypothetical protein